MSRDSERRHRHSQRLPGHDYAGEAAYFVTIVTENRELWFGEIVEDSMHLSICGLMVDSWWCQLPRRYPTVMLDAYVVMPNHLHGIIRIRNIQQDASASQTESSHTVKVSLGQAIGWFKTVTTTDYMLGVKRYDWPQFDGKLWQRNYHDRVIRNRHELNYIRSYIATNPERWSQDEEYPPLPNRQ